MVGFLTFASEMFDDEGDEVGESDEENNLIKELDGVQEGPNTSSYSVELQETAGIVEEDSGVFDSKFGGCG